MKKTNETNETATAKAGMKVYTVTKVFMRNGKIDGTSYVESVYTTAEKAREEAEENEGCKIEWNIKGERGETEHRNTYGRTFLWTVYYIKEITIK